LFSLQSSHPFAGRVRASGYRRSAPSDGSAIVLCNMIMLPCGKSCFCNCYTNIYRHQNRNLDEEILQ